MIVIVTNTALEFGRNVQEGVVLHAEERWRSGWRKLVSIPWRAAIRGLVDWRQFSGIIAQIWGNEVDDNIAASGVPAINVSAALANTRLPAVVVDDRMAGAQVAKYFLARGYRHFAYRSSPYPVALSATRGIGFVSVVHAAGYEVSWYGDHPAKLPPGAVRARGETTLWLRSLPRPTALLSCHDYLAAELYGAAVATGISIPEQISLVGIDDDPGTHYAMMGISSIPLPGLDIGKTAATMLDRLMAGSPLAARTALMPIGEVITRTSSDCFAMDDADVLKAVKFIRENATQGINVSDVVNAVALSRRTLERRFRESMGNSPKNEIRRVQIEHAKYLLSRTQMSVSEIACAVGLQDRSLLSNIMRVTVGVSPTQYRSRHTGEPSTMPHWYAIATPTDRRRTTK